MEILAVLCTLGFSGMRFCYQGPVRFENAPGHHLPVFPSFHPSIFPFFHFSLPANIVIINFAEKLKP